MEATPRNPYEILGVTQAASTEEIVRAVGAAMKARKFPARAIADAQKQLMNPQKRLLADFLRPILPPVQRFKPGDYSVLAAPAPQLPFLQYYDGLAAELAQVLAEEQEAEPPTHG